AFPRLLAPSRSCRLFAETFGLAARFVCATCYAVMESFQPLFVLLRISTDSLNRHVDAQPREHHFPARLAAERRVLVPRVRWNPVPPPEAKTFLREILVSASCPACVDFHLAHRLPSFALSIMRSMKLSTVVTALFSPLIM